MVAIDDRWNHSTVSGDRFPTGPHADARGRAHRRYASIVLSFTLLLTAAACISSPLEPAEQDQAQNLNVAPSNVWLSVGNTQRVVAWVTGPESGEQISYTWTTSDPDVLEIVETDSTVVLYAKKSGSVKVGVTADKPGKRIGQRADAVTVTVTDSNQEASVGRILGVPELQNTWSGLPFSGTYDAKFTEWGDTHWSRSAGQWEYTYYDRALAWYAAWWRTGDARYLERAETDVLAYRDDYVLPNNGGVPPRWVFPEGLAIHYILTGDPLSGDAIALMAKRMSEVGWLDNMLTTNYQDGRIQGRAVLAQLIAAEVGAPPLRDWNAELSRGIEHLLEWYQVSGADGSWEMNQYCGGQANFQVSHALLEVLIRYHDLVNPDPRIPDVVRKSLNYMWQWWDAGAQAFSYNTVECAAGGTGPAVDLNMLIVFPFGWYYQVSGEDVYRQRGDDVLQAGLAKTFWSGHKQFNQSFMRSWRYPQYTN